MRWPGGVALSRETLDFHLAAAAIEAGAHFLPGTLARLLPPNKTAVRELTLQRGGDSSAATARVVVAADGLSGSLTARGGEVPVRIASASYVGAGTSCADAGEVPAGVVFMACGRTGYVGLVRLENGRLNCAAALDPNALRRHGGPGQAAAANLEQAGAPVPAGLADAVWHGTPPLTRHRQRPWAERLFLVGDAASYYEPFTGEGMAWALVSAAELAPLACARCRTGTRNSGAAGPGRSAGSCAPVSCTALPACCAGPG